MKKYTVTIIETLKKTIEVEAKSRIEAEQHVMDRWRNGEFILDADSFTGVNFKAVQQELEHEAR